MLGPTSLFKFSISFALSYFILSFPLSQGTLFQALYKKTSHITRPIFSTMTKSVSKTWDSGVRYVKRVFSNAKPQIDKVSIESSSWQRDIPKYDPGTDFNQDEETKLRQELSSSSQSNGED